MIPRLHKVSDVQAYYLDFIETLQQQGFAGEVHLDYANRLVQSTDNSIYQRLPQAVVYPRHTQDLQCIASLLSEERFSNICIGLRGGGTGTNAQSLTEGVVVDTSKHMNKILEINPHERWAKVQAGVVKDQLNQALKPYGLFFAPELSTSNRATIGGMINTDASGQGSVLYGKTRDHVLEIESVLLGGERWVSAALTEEQLCEIKQRNDTIGAIHRELDQLYGENKTAIARQFPTLNRCLTGYDLAHIRDESGCFNLNSVLCGSEGSLALITEAKLNLLPIPKFSALIIVKYNSFEASLRDANALMAWKPASIETIDSNVLNLAMQDIIWSSVSEWFSDVDLGIQGINLIEYVADTQEYLQSKLDALCHFLQQRSDNRSASRVGFSMAVGADQINKIWAMRKRAVGLLGASKGQQKPIPFVEDTAVPPENLADFIMEFRQLLDQHQLSYGMFGHVDAGVLHVRPALDMKDPDQEVLVRTISDEVVKLTQRYKGLLWGEHGKGVRSEYAPEFFGALYPLLQHIKGLFDPRNQLNPGKIATPSQSTAAQLLKIDAVATRGQHDRQIDVRFRDVYDSALSCNGNGACFNYDLQDAMCPSWKGTRQRVHSPKGRATLIREWLRLLSQRQTDLDAEVATIRSGNFLKSLPLRVRNTRAKKQGDYDFSNEVYDAMMGCLACKSCVGQCPIKVNVPDFRARFLEVYYGRYLRPLKDYVIGSLEFITPWMAKFPYPYNWAMGNRVMQALMKKSLGMIDSPSLSGVNLSRELARRNVQWANKAHLATLSSAERSRSVIVVQDAFTSFFETHVLLDLIDLLHLLKINVYIAPYKPNGKPLHVHGFMQAFIKVAEKNLSLLSELSEFGIPFVGVDPSMTLTYRSEYVKEKQAFSSDLSVPDVMLIQEWLPRVLQQSNLELLKPLPHQTFKLLPHCTEKTTAASSLKQWQAIFSILGQDLQLLDAGCCGMSGTFGHEAQHLDLSKTLYDLSWREHINNDTCADQIVATGYSCRSQVKRFDQQTILHPVQALKQVLSYTDKG